MTHEPAGLKRSFAPVTDERTQLLLLGSLPGERSLLAGRYYAHPRNQFWRLAGHLIGDRDAAAGLEHLEYEERLALLLDHGIGLWDVVASASRRGSLDGAISGHAANDLAALVARLPALEAIGFNGSTAWRLGRRALGDVPAVELLPLPSSSPALTLPFEAKLEQWLPLGRFVRHGSGRSGRDA